ncbi:MAG: hypothetical protein IKL65_00495 [Bacilli bacterium]|nr:hypothetical protein [Bacilli bacterium]MBR6689795.1 hypothetical protein [Bacilli bacterium]
MEDDILGLLAFISGGLLFVLIVLLTYNYINLQKFKSCYDINFQDVKCQKYINY